MGKEPYPDLKFDQQAATDAINQLQAVINLLTSQTNNRATKAKNMGPPNWTGTYSDQFYNNELPRMKKDAGTLVGKLQGLISTISNAQQNYNLYKQQNDMADGKVILAPGPLGQTSPPSGGTTTA